MCSGHLCTAHTSCLFFFFFFTDTLKKVHWQFIFQISGLLHFLSWKYMLYLRWSLLHSLPHCPTALKLTLEASQTVVERRNWNESFSVHHSCNSSNIFSPCFQIILQCWLPDMARPTLYLKKKECNRLEISFLYISSASLSDQENSGHCDCPRKTASKNHCRGNVWSQQKRKKLMPPLTVVEDGVTQAVA